MHPSFLQEGVSDYSRRPAVDPSSLMSNIHSRLIYPPVGSTFEGHASQGVLAARSRPIDSMTDMHYRKAQPLQYGDMLMGELRGIDSMRC